MENRIKVLCENVAVIGAGAAGLITGKILREHGLKVTIFEASNTVGGTWVLDNNVDVGNSDDFTTSSMYESLCTNLPIDIMNFSDLQIKSSDGTFPNYSVIRDYLVEYSREFNIDELIRFNTKIKEVKEVSKILKSNKHLWSLSILDKNKNQETQETFDGVVVCNGHYSKPWYPNLKGTEHFKGSILHSHYYREPTPWVDKQVLVVGSGSSGCDIARELSRAGSTVILSVGHAMHMDKAVDEGAVTLKPYLTGINEAGQALFKDGSLSSVDTILFCTGYSYHFPFFNANNNESNTINNSNIGSISAEGFKVDHLYKHVFDYNYPSLSYIGLPFKVIPFPLFEYQAHWVSRVYSGLINLPSPKIMKNETDEYEWSLKNQNISNKYFHLLGPEQFNYCNELAKLCKKDENVQQKETINHDINPVPIRVIQGYKNAKILRTKVLGY